MIKNEFESKIRDLKKSDNIGNTAVAYALMLIGLYFLIRNIALINSKPDFSFLDFLVMTIASTIIPISAGVLMLYLLPKQYEATEIPSMETVTAKMELFKDSLSEYTYEVEEIDDFIHFGCKKKNREIFDVFIFVDDEKYLFNVLTRGGYRARGVWDAGNSKRITNIIKACLQQTVSPMPCSVEK